MRTSRVLEVKSAIFDALTAAPAFQGIQVSWGLPANPESTWVLVGDVEWENDDWATNRGREEKFKIAIIFEVQTTGATPREVETSIMQLQATAEDIFAASPGFGLPNIVTSNYSPGRLISWVADRKGAAQVHGSITVTARF